MQATRNKGTTKIGVIAIAAIITGQSAKLRISLPKKINLLSLYLFSAEMSSNNVVKDMKNNEK
jgi:hypothetical protein